MLFAVNRAASSATRLGGSWRAAFALFVYAVPFSFAYTGLTTGTGALVLFGFVQVTMIGAGRWRGERLATWQWTGLAVAIVGLIYLLLPGIAAPPASSAGLMALAGVAWGTYSLLGRRSATPVADTAGNFCRAVPFIPMIALMHARPLHVSAVGVGLAVTSGAVTSGLGYAVWYRALRGLTATRAAVVQLSVPVLAAAAGVAFLGESLSTRLIFAAILVIGGIGLTLSSRDASRRS